MAKMTAGRATYRLLRRLVRWLMLGGFIAASVSCGGGGSGSQAPFISIDVPTSASSYPTTLSYVRLGGTISGASYVHVTNALTGSAVDGFVTYNQGQGSWFADVTGLAPGDNPITATADADGTGVRTASAHITVIRPLQPADLIFNGPDQSSSSTFWTDNSSAYQSHKIALFADGTGRSTTGSALSDMAGGVTNLTWTKLSPDSILISNCSTCSFQKISRISGSLSDGTFYGQIDTVGGAQDSSLHVFILSSGNL